MPFPYERKKELNDKTNLTTRKKKELNDKTYTLNNIYAISL